MKKPLFKRKIRVLFKENNMGLNKLELKKWYNRNVKKRWRYPRLHKQCNINMSKYK